MRGVLLLVSMLATAQSPALSTKWPPTNFQTQQTTDPAVVLKTFDVELRCAVDAGAGLVDISGQIPQLIPARSFAAINATLMRTVLDRVDLCEPSSMPVTETWKSEIFDECEVTFRSPQAVSVSCRLGWDGPAMGVHPDGEIENATYRVLDGHKLTKDEMLRPEELGRLRSLLEARFRKENPMEFEGADEEWVDEVLSWATAAPLLTRDGLLFQYTEHHYDMAVTLSYRDAEPFLQPFILSLAKHALPK